MTNTTKFLAVALLCLSSAAAAQPTPPADKPMPDKAEMQRHMAEMCQDRKAHAAGELTYLETKLALSDKQRPLFERWKKIKLAEANAAECAVPPPPDGEPSLVDQLKQEEKFLHARLDSLKAELPALDAFYASLSDAQKKAFRPAPPPGAHRGGPMMGRGPAGHGPDAPGRDGPGNEPPPNGAPVP